MLSGVARCGVCGGVLYGTFRGGGRPMVYACKPNVHVARNGAPLDDLVSAVVLELLGRTDIVSRLTDRPDFDAGAMSARRTALAARADELARMFSRGEIDASQLRSGTSDLRTQIAGIDQILADITATSPAVQLLDGDPGELENRWGACTPDIRGKIIDELMTVTVLPTPRGVKGVTVDRETDERVVNLDYVRITPKV